VFYTSVLVLVQANTQPLAKRHTYNMESLRVLHRHNLIDKASAV